jgi:hypothetical protein
MKSGVGAMTAYSMLRQLVPMHEGKGGMSLVGGSSNVRSPFPLASIWKMAMNSERKKGVRMRKIIFLGFLNVRMKFLYINNFVCPKKLRGDGTDCANSI